MRKPLVKNDLRLKQIMQTFDFFSKYAKVIVYNMPNLFFPDFYEDVAEELIKRLSLNQNTSPMVMPIQVIF